MIGIDTNVLIRYLTNDDPAQSPVATDFIERRLSEAEPGFISVVTIAETAWVLGSRYGQTSSEIAAAIERILESNPIIIVENEQAVFAAMVALKGGSGSFGDALIGELGLRAGCSCTVTFDRKALRLPGFAAL